MKLEAMDVAALAKTSEVMRTVDAYAFDYAAESKLAPSRLAVEREIRAICAADHRGRPVSMAAALAGVEELARNGGPRVEPHVAAAMFKAMLEAASPLANGESNG